MEECNQKFGLSKTLKSHIISDHLQEYFEMTGKSLLCQSDEHVEAIHSSYRKFMERHQYKMNNISSKNHHYKQEKAVKHWNAQNI